MLDQLNFDQGKVSRFGYNHWNAECLIPMGSISLLDRLHSLLPLRNI